MRGELAEKRDFKGVWIPKEIWLNKKLSIMEKLFLVEIDSLDNENHCFASNLYFSKFFNLGITRTSQIINSLIKKGFISAQYERKGNEIVKRVLTVNCKNLFNKVYEGIQKSVRRYPEKCKENNTDNNTNNKKEGGKRFFPPSIDEIQKYLEERNIKNFGAEQFYDFYESKNWMIGKNKMKDWKAAVRTWERREDKNKPFDCTEVIKNLK